LSQLREKITTEDRRRKIIEYIKSHPGCKMDEIVKGVSKFASRALVFKIIADFVKEEIVENRAINRRDSSLYLREDNLLLRITEVLDRIEKAYSKLLYKSKEHLQKKDFAGIAKNLNLSSPDPQKWIDKDRIKYQFYEIAKSEAFHDTIKKLGLENVSIVIFPIDEQKILEIINSDEKKLEESVKKLLELKNQFNQWKDESEQLDYYLKHIDFKESTKDFEFSIIIDTSTKIFFLLSDILFYNFNFIWSKNIKDKNLLERLSLLLFERLSKINLKLSEFIDSIKVLLPEDEYIKTMINSRYETQDLPLVMSKYFYQELKMESEIVEVIQSIMVLDEEKKIQI
jgi:hypothetical protein